MSQYCYNFDNVSALIFGKSNCVQSLLAEIERDSAAECGLIIVALKLEDREREAYMYARI